MNEILFVAIMGMVLAQLLKFPVYYFKHGKLYPPIILSTGLMPSSHTSFVVSLTLAIGFDAGTSSAVFALAMVFAMITIHDAVMVRGESGKQAVVINELVMMVDELGQSINPKNAKEVRQDKLKTLIGHTGTEVLAGIILGIVWPIIYFVLIK